MAYHRPPLFVRRVFNPLAARFGVGGASRLTVVGRRTGAPRQVPVIPVEHAGARYLVSPRGEADWVRNLRAAGRAELHRRGTTERIFAVEIPVAGRSPILAAYRKLAGRAVSSHFAALPDAADHPVFRIERL